MEEYSSSSSEIKILRSSCFQCWSMCGVLVHVKDGVVVKVEGNPENPVNRGFICPKGRAAIDIEYHPDRIKYPLRRVGERGEGKWERISWDDALNIITTKLKEIKGKYGAEAVFFGTGTRMLGLRFAYAFGTPNWGEPGCLQCDFPRTNASWTTFGEILNTWIASPEDFEKTKCIVAWGYNGVNTWPPFGLMTLNAKKRGAKLIVVDPRFTELTAKADEWAQLRPGTDGALALGMLNVIISEGLYDKEFVGKWTVGFDKLIERVKPHDPEKVESITWVPVETIRKIARMYATEKSGMLLAGVAPEHTENAFQSFRALFTLEAITGNVDVPGGNAFYLSPGHRGVYYYTSIFGNVKGILPPVQEKKRMGYGVFKWGCGPSTPFPTAHLPTVVKAILTGKPYPIKAWLTFADNPVASYGGTQKVEEAIRKVEFSVIGEMFMTDTAKFADIILPVCTWLEKDELVDIFLPNGVTFRQKVVEPPGECWPDGIIFHELAKRMGFDELYPWKTLEEECNWNLEPLGLTFTQLKEKGFIRVPMKYKKYEAEGFNTPSRKVEIYSKVLEEDGYDPLPNYVETVESPVSRPDLAKDYPLVLTTGGRVLAYWHTDLRQIPKLRELEPKPYVEINPKTAEKLGIRDDDLVVVETPRGAIKVYAKYSKMDPRVVSTQHGWAGEANDNLLTSCDPPFDPFMGSMRLRALLCRVKKV